MSLHDILNEMRLGFSQSPVKDLYQDTALAQLFCNDDLPNALNFFNIYFDSSEETRSWFKSCFEDFRYQIQFDDLEIILHDMRVNNLFNQANIEALESHANFEQLIIGLRSLQMEGILNQENFDLTCSSTTPYHLTNALISLNQAEILNQANREMIATHPEPINLVLVLIKLNNEGILTTENRAIIATHQRLDDLFSVVLVLQSNQLLNFQNFETVAGHSNIEALSNVLYKLYEAELLNQENFDVLMQARHAPLLTDYADQNLWSRIPPHLLTQANFDRFLNTEAGVVTVDELTAELNQILVAAAAPRAAAVEDFNDSQSTHTASVHRSVSASVTKLSRRYDEHLDLEATIVEIQDYVKNLDDSFQNAAAR